MLAMVKQVIHRATDVLRADPWAVGGGRSAQRLCQLGLLLLAFGMAYGAVMGSFGGLRSDRLLAITYSAVKVPLLLTGTFIISLPSFFVVNTLLGLRTDFSYAMRAMVATQAGLTVILASFAPFTIVWYVSYSSYGHAVLFNTVMFGIATFLAQKLLRRFYQPLIHRNHRHHWVLRVWLVTYAFVGIQMGWLLRPFIGDPNMSTTFIRQQAWGNAYEALLRTILSIFQ